MGADECRDHRLPHGNPHCVHAIRCQDRPIYLHEINCPEVEQAAFRLADDAVMGLKRSTISLPQPYRLGPSLASESMNKADFGQVWGVI